MRARKGRREEAVKHELIDVIPAIRTLTPSDIYLMDAVMVDNGHGSRGLPSSYVLASVTSVAEAKFETDRFKINSDEILSFLLLHPMEWLVTMC